MPRDDSGTLYQDLLNSWADLLRAMSSLTTGIATLGGPAAGDGPRPAKEDEPQLVALLGEISLILATSGARYWLGAAETLAKLLPAIDGNLGASREDPTRAAAARASLINELRAALRSLTDLSYQESRRAQAEFENFARRLAPDVTSEASSEHWRRWTVKS